MILSYRKREVIPRDPPQQSQEKRSKLFGNFWSNFFRFKKDRYPTADEKKRRSCSVDETAVAIVIEDPSLVTLSPSVSFESVNTIQSTRSFSFVNGKSYGQNHRRQPRGRRIPVDDTNFRRPSKPQLPPQCGSTTSTAFNSPQLDARILGMRPKVVLDLKRKYNLQSCESLALGGTELREAVSVLRNDAQGRPPINNDIRKRPEPEVRICELAENQRQANSTLTLKKRRAPLPPTSVTPQLPRQFHPRYPIESPLPQLQRHRRCQSDTTACDRLLKVKVHVPGKGRAPNPPPTPQPIIKLSQSDRGSEIHHVVAQVHEPTPSQDEVSEMPSIKFRRNQVGPSPLVQSPSGHKPNPRPWYKRTSSKSPTKPSLINLPNMSNLDREAAKIVEENHRRSAEFEHNQTAKDLITLFNKTFEQRGDMVASGSSVIDSKSIQAVGSEERKKLAIVQPQKNSKVTTPHPPVNGVGSSVINPPTPLTVAISHSITSSQNGDEGVEWTCPRCTLHNLPWRAFCEACFLRKGSNYELPLPKVLVMQTHRGTANSIHPLPGEDSTAGNSNSKSYSGGNETTEGISNSNPIQPKKSHEAPKNENSAKANVSMQTEAVIPRNSKLEKSAIPSTSPGKGGLDNFLGHVPSKKNVCDEKLVGMKLVEPKGDEIEEVLNVEALREARLAFFSKKSDLEERPNNLSPIPKSHESTTEIKELNLPFLNSNEANEDLEIIDCLLNAYQDTKSSRTETIGFLESLPPKYEFGHDALRKIVFNRRRELETTNTFIPSCQSIQRFIRKGISYLDRIMEEGSDTNLDTEEAGRAPVPSTEQIQTKTSNQDEVKLLRKIDWAISQGDYRLAAKLAYELAKLNALPPEEEPITIRAYVEDRLMQQGPFLITVTDSMTVGNLKTKIESDWGIPTNFQKWILGKQMANENEAKLAEFKLRQEGLCFLYLVTPEVLEGKSIEKCDPPIKNTLNHIQHSQQPGSTNVKSGHETVTNPAISEEDSEQPRNTEDTVAFSNIAQNEATDVQPSLRLEGAETKQPESDTGSTFNLTPTIQNFPDPFQGHDITGNTHEIFNENQQSGLAEATLIDLVHKPNPDLNSSLEDPMTSRGQGSMSIKISDSTNDKTESELTPTATTSFVTKHITRRGSLDLCKRDLSLKACFSTPPFRRRLSGTLTKQIQMFESLNNPTKMSKNLLKGEQSSSSSSSLFQSPISKSSHCTPVQLPMVDINLEPSSSKNLQKDYQKLLELEKSDVIRSEEEIECPICLSIIPKGQGVILRDCLHSFCQECLIGAIEYSEEVQVKCPYRDSNYACDSVIQEREVKVLVPTEMFNRLLAKSIKLAECRISNAFHCQTQDCSGWCIYEDNVNNFLCPVCSRINCLNCRAIHEGIDCHQYQRQIAVAAETDENAKTSRVMLEKMMSRGEALECPACHVILLKKWGCDWVKCSYCKTEICWVTKGFRWGPGGKGDTNGGCRCGVNGIKCHPKCTYCH